MLRERRLAAVMFTDIVGYTALAQRNEALAMTLLEEHRALVRPHFPRHGGREVKTIGDAFLAEFDSALEAVRCAYEIQQSFRELNQGRPSDKQVQVRVGIHLGDVIHSQNDVYGDAVNVASRIEPLAAPGGVCISEEVYRQVRNKLEFPILSMGRKELRNVEEPVEVFRVVLPWERQETQGRQEMRLQSLDVNRVAVLPFSNLSPDPNDEYFADGLTEELIERLAQVKELQVIARTSVMGYKKKELKAGEIGRELRVGALVEGSVRKSGTRIRVTAQLIDSSTESHLWSSRYDRDLQDVFAVQSDIAEQVAGALKVHLVRSEKQALGQKPTEDMEAYTLYLRGRSLWNRRTSRDVREALRLFQEAVGRDPGYARAFTGVADCYSILVDRLEVLPSEGAPKAVEAAEAALQLDPKLPEGHASLGLALYLGGKTEEGLAELEKAVALNPGYASAYQWYAIGLGGHGRADEAGRAIAMAEKADPMSPIILYNAGFLAWAYGRDQEALEKWGRALEIRPDFEIVHHGLAAFHIQKGRREEALKELKLIESFAAGDDWFQMGRNALLAFLYGRLGDRGKAEGFLNALLKSQARPSAIALAYAGTGDMDKVFEYLMKAVDDNSSFTSALPAHPLLQDLRSDPRFKDYMAARKSVGRT